MQDLPVIDTDGTADHASAGSYRSWPAPGTLALARLTEVKESAAPGLGHQFVKRTIDIVVSLVLIIMLAPVFLILSFLVWSTSDGPVFFRQERLGLCKRPFVMLKLRTMYENSDDQIHREYVTSMLSGGGEPTVTDNGICKLDADPRVTPIGAWLRRTSLDELPQLVNVLRGEMSLVGPRPMLDWEAKLLDEPYQRRFAVKPGITGLWQVSGRSWLSMRRALELDVEYVTRRSVARDLIILVRTVPAVFRGGAR